MAGAFFHYVVELTNGVHTARRVMSGFIAFFIVVASTLKPATAYYFLVSLCSYVSPRSCACAGSAACCTQKLIRISGGRNCANVVKLKTRIDPLHAVVFCFARGFLLFAVFAK